MVAAGALTEPRNTGGHIGVRARPRRHVERALWHQAPLTDRERLACLGSAAANASLRVLAYLGRSGVGIRREVRVVRLAAYIAHLEHHVFGELALHAE